jgi:hypothetical protein
MVWAAIGHNFKSKLIITQESVTAERYRDDIIKASNLIEDAVRCFGDSWLFQQDNARPHIARTTTDYFADNHVRLLENWPSYSPDLNIIEIVWAIMKRRVVEEQPTTIDELCDCIYRVWENLSYHTIESLIDSLPRRCGDVCAYGGLTIVH